METLELLKLVISATHVKRRHWKRPKALQTLALKSSWHLSSLITARFGCKFNVPNVPLVLGQNLSVKRSAFSRKRHCSCSFSMEAAISNLKAYFLRFKWRSPRALRSTYREWFEPTNWRSISTLTPAVNFLSSVAVLLSSPLCLGAAPPAFIDGNICASRSNLPSLAFSFLPLPFFFSSFLSSPLRSAGTRQEQGLVLVLETAETLPRPPPSPPTLHPLQL